MAVRHNTGRSLIESLIFSIKGHPKDTPSLAGPSQLKGDIREALDPSHSENGSCREKHLLGAIAKSETSSALSGIA